MKLIKLKLDEPNKVGDILYNGADTMAVLNKDGKWYSTFSIIMEQEDINKMKPHIRLLRIEEQ